MRRVTVLRRMEAYTAMSQCARCGRACSATSETKPRPLGDIQVTWMRYGTDRGASSDLFSSLLTVLCGAGLWGGLIYAALWQYESGDLQCGADQQSSPVNEMDKLKLDRHRQRAADQHCRSMRSFPAMAPHCSHCQLPSAHCCLGPSARCAESAQRKCGSGRHTATARELGPMLTGGQWSLAHCTIYPRARLQAPCDH